MLDNPLAYELKINIHPSDIGLGILDYFFETTRRSASHIELNESFYLLQLVFRVVVFENADYHFVQAEQRVGKSIK